LTSQTPCRSAVFGFRRQVRIASGRFSPSDCPSEGTATCPAQVRSTANFSSGQTFWSLTRLRSNQCNPKRDSGRSETYPRACAPFGTRAFAARRRPSVRRGVRSLSCRLGGAIPGVGFPRRFADRERRDSPAQRWPRPSVRPPVSLLTSGAERSLRFCRIPTPTSVGSTPGSVDGILRHGTPRRLRRIWKGTQAQEEPGLVAPSTAQRDSRLRQGAKPRSRRNGTVARVAVMQRGSGGGKFFEGYEPASRERP